LHEILNDEESISRYRKNVKGGDFFKYPKGLTLNSDARGLTCLW